MSASDDQTIRIWNWQSRTCISVLTGTLCVRGGFSQENTVPKILHFRILWDLAWTKGG